MGTSGQEDPVKPAPFRYHRPETIEEAVSLLASDDDARVLAGGQSLVPMMSLRLAQPEQLVDINFVSGGDQLAVSSGELSIGARVRQQALIDSPVVAEAAPLLAKAGSFVGYPATRHRGTVVGSAAHADPAAEIPAALLALDAQFDLRASTRRSVAAADFFIDYYTTAIEPGEMLECIRVPVSSPATRSAFVELARRYHDFPICAVAVRFEVEEGALANVRIALAGAGPNALRGRGGEHLLEGQRPTEEAFTAAAEKIAEEIEPLGDVHGSPEYRRKVARVLVRRALTQAMSLV